MEPGNLQALEALSREFAVACDVAGRLRWMDARAQRLLAVPTGTALDALAPAGTHGKLGELLAQAASAEVHDWEVPLLLSGRPVTVTFSATPAGNGDVLLVGHLVPAPYAEAVDQIAESMADVVALNRQVVSQKRELERRNAELARLNRELEESHRGMVTMHSELEDRSTELRHTAEIKSRIVSNVSHEFRTPLHSILGLADLLTAGSDGALNEEQVKQVGFIRASAEELVQLVDDLLDLSRTEAGKATMRMERFDGRELFAALRGMLKPLVPPGSPVTLDFAEPPEGLTFETDKAKVSQILRNLVSNALKFTENGSVRVTLASDGGSGVKIAVQDTGIGIAADDLGRIFEEFGQVGTPFMPRWKGTGLGLALSRQLADLLGGRIEVESREGEGSTFTLFLPREHPEVREMQQLFERSRARPVGPATILVVEDDRKTLFIYEKYLVMAGFHVLPARTIDDARRIITESRPAAIVLDIMLEGETSWAFLGDLKRNPDTRDIPVLVVTVTNREQKARALGADEFWLKPVDQDRLLKRLRGIAKPGLAPRVLVIDDDDTARYIIRKHLADSPFKLSEAATGPEGVAMAQRESPHVILLDFLLKDMTAFDVLDELKSDPRTRSIPVIIVTSHALDGMQQQRLLAEAEAVISKQSLSRELAINRIRDALRKSGVGTLESAT